MNATQTNLRRIAHLSDAHILEPRPAGGRASYELGVRFVSLGRPLDAPEREDKLLSAFATAERAGSDHFVVSGDLTETGTDAQFEAFARVLDATRIDPSRITLVPGNHDAYTAPDAWTRALAGPLAPWAPTSARAAGHVVDRGGVCILPIDVSCHQPVTRSAGELTREGAEVLARRLEDLALADRAVVIVQHHPPYKRPSAWQWVDGLRGWDALMALLERFPNVHLLHGHLHRAADAIVRFGRERIFGAPAVVNEPRVRLYDVDGSTLTASWA